MKVLVLTFCIICAVTVGASAISCYIYPTWNQEYGLDWKKSKMELNDCSNEDDLCIIVNVQHKYHNESQSYYGLRCGRPSECDVQGSFTIVKFTKRFSTRCCNTSNCIPELPALPPDNETRNGVICPACLSETHQECVPRSAMECTGEEKYCITYYEISVKNSLLHSYGCTTQNICQRGDVRIVSITFEVRASCTTVGSTNSLPIGNFLWCVVSPQKTIDRNESFLCADDEDVCVSEVIRTVYDGETRVEYLHRCGKSHECGRRGTISSSEKTISINTTCCDQNQCHAPEPVLPPVSNKTNGLICPDCYTSSSPNCIAKNVKQCTGKEDVCIQYSKTTKKDFHVSKEVLYGCGSGSVCEAGPSRVIPNKGFKQKIIAEVICNKAPPL